MNVCSCVEQGNGKMKLYLLCSLYKLFLRACINAPDSRVELVAEYVDGLVSCFVGYEEKFWVFRGLIMALVHRVCPHQGRK